MRYICGADRKNCRGTVLSVEINGLWWENIGRTGNGTQDLLLVRGALTIWAILVGSRSGQSVLHPLNRLDHNLTYNLLNNIFHGLIFGLQWRMDVVCNMIMGTMIPFKNGIMDSKLNLRFSTGPGIGRDLSVVCVCACS